MTKQQATNILIENSYHPDYLPKNINFHFLYGCRKAEVEITKAFLTLFPDWLYMDDPKESNVVNRVAESGNLEFLKYVVELGAPLNLRDKDGDIPMQTAINWKHPALAQYLLEQGANPINCNNSDRTPLYQAYRKGYTPLFEQMLRYPNVVADEDIVRLVMDYKEEEKRYNHASPFLLEELAHQVSCIVVLEKMLKCGGNPNALVPSTNPNKDQKPVLYWAVESDLTSIVDLLLKYGAAIEAKTKMGWTSMKYAEYIKTYHPDVPCKVYDVLKRFGAKEVDVSEQAFIEAAIQNDISTIRSMLREGIPINCTNKDGLTALYKAVAKGHYEMAALLLENGADPNIIYDGTDAPLGFVVTNKKRSRAEKQTMLQQLLTAGARPNEGEHGSIAFYYALLNDEFELAELLYQAGANLNSVNRYYESLLLKAVGWNKQALFDYVVQRGIDPNGQGGLGKKGKNSSLTMAVKKDHIAMLKQLVAIGADPNIKDYLGYNALMCCADKKPKENHDLLIEMAQCLIKAGADIWATQNTGATALDLATWKNSPVENVIKMAVTWDRVADRNAVDYVQLVDNMTMNDFNQWINIESVATIEKIINAGFDINNISATDTPPLVAAAKRYKLKTFNLLLDKGAAIHRHGKSTGVLSSAIKLGLETVQNLVERGANIHDENGYQPLSSAAAANNLEVVRYLLALGADPNLARRSIIPLYRAVQKQNLEMVQLLLDYGAEVNRKITGTTPLDEANRRGLKEMAALLSNHIHVNQRDKEGRTPLFKACIKGDVTQIQTLLKKGASVSIIDQYGKTLLSYAALRAQVAGFMDIPHQALIVHNIVGTLPPVFVHLLKYHQLPADVPIDVHQKDYRGDTLLHHAVQYIDVAEVTDQLLDLGADPYAQNAMGETPILKADSLGKKEIQHCFEKRNIRTKGTTLEAANRQVGIYNRIEAMEQAIQAGNLMTVNRLLDEKQVNIHQLRNFHSPIAMAIRQEDEEMIRLLWQKGAHLEISGQPDMTPLYLTLFREPSTAMFHLFYKAMEQKWADKTLLYPALLKATKWEEERANQFVYENLGNRLSLRFKTDFMDLDLRIWGKITLFLRITLTNNEVKRSFLQSVLWHQRRIGTHYEQLLLSWITHEEIKLQNGKYFKRKLYLSDLTTDHLSYLFQPKWVPIAAEDFNFYLAAPIETQLTITPENQVLAHKRLLAYVAEHPKSVFFSETLLATEDLSGFFYESSHVKTVLDEEGNIINLKQGGDEWIFWELTKIKDYIVAGSFITIQDDGGVFWKVVYYPDRVAYFREALQSDGLAIH